MHAKSHICDYVYTATCSLSKPWFSLCKQSGTKKAPHRCLFRYRCCCELNLASYDKSFDRTKARSTSIASSLNAHQALLIGSSGDNATPITWRPSFQ